jgi:hypothetical protein
VVDSFPPDCFCLIRINRIRSFFNGTLIDIWSAFSRLPPLLG